MLIPHYQKAGADYLNVADISSKIVKKLPQSTWHIDMTS